MIAKKNQHPLEQLSQPLLTKKKKTQPTRFFQDPKGNLFTNIHSPTEIILAEATSPNRARRSRIQNPNSPAALLGDLLEPLVLRACCIGGTDVTTCCDAMASCSRLLTSSALAKSTGLWPSWFFRNGSAPCASSRAQS